MTTVEVKLEELDTAISGVKSLADAIDNQRAAAQRATPVPLPTLADGKLGRTSTWLRDQEAVLTVPRDIARLLDEGDTVSFDVSGSGSIEDMETMLGELAAERLEELEISSYSDELSDEEREALGDLAPIIESQMDNENVMTSMFETLGPEGAARAMETIDAGLTRPNGPGYNRTDDNDASYEERSEALQGLLGDLQTGLATAAGSAAWQQPSQAPNPHSPSVAQQYAYQMANEMMTNDVYASHGGIERIWGHDGYPDDIFMGAAEAYDFAERDGTDLPAGTMDFFVDELGERPDAGLTFFSDTERQDYYFSEYEWHDGYENISDTMNKIGTDETNVEMRGEATSQMVSSFFGQIAERDDFNAEDATAASPHVAELLKFYMPAVDEGLGSRTIDGEPGTLSDFTINHVGTFDHLPKFFSEDLKTLMQVGMASQEGTGSIAEGIGTFQQTQINSVAAELAPDPHNGDLKSELQSILTGNARLNGAAENAVGEVDIEGARDRDQQRQVFIELVGDAAGLVPLPGADTLGGDLAESLVDYGYNKTVDLGAGAAEDAFANETEATTSESNDSAEESLARAQVGSYLAMVEAGVIDESEVDERWFEDGQLISLSEATQPSDDEPGASERDPDWYAGDAKQRSEHVLSPELYRTAYLLAFSDPYSESE